MNTSTLAHAGYEIPRARKVADDAWRHGPRSPHMPAVTATLRLPDIMRQRVRVEMRPMGWRSASSLVLKGPLRAPASLLCWPGAADKVAELSTLLLFCWWLSGVCSIVTATALRHTRRKACHACWVRPLPANASVAEDYLEEGLR